MKWRHLSLPPLSWLVVLLPLLGAFFYTPLAFGGVTPETVRVLDILLAASVVMWMVLLACQRRMPSISRICLAGIFVISVLGGAYLLNPLSVHREFDWKFIPLEGSIPWLPGSVDYAASFPVLLNLGALVLVGLVLQDAISNSKTRWFLFRVVALSGFVIAIIGIIQKADGHESMLWVTPERSGAVFFAAFRYHGNAASFLNLCWPAAFAVWIRSRTKDPTGMLASLDFCVLFFIAAAVFVNTSKAGHVLGLSGMVAMGWRFRSELRPRNVNKSVVIVTSLLLSLMLALVVLPAIFNSIARWNSLATHGGSLSGRLSAYEACLRALPETGFFGTGAGTFHLVFPEFSAYLGDRINGYWYHAHQDWLQGLMEWGFVGFVAWASLFLGAFVRLFRRIRQARMEDQMEISDSVSLIALGVVLLHALADFPLQIPAVQLLVVFYLAVAWGNTHRRGTHTPQKNPPMAGRELT
ncbi:MAG: O-antigen ligase family protein [Verrucomicrobiales bacterium]